MRRKLYVDSGAFIALTFARDQAHHQISEAFRKIRRDRDLLVTSEAVVTETTTRLRYDAGLPAALAFHQALIHGRLSGDLIVRDSDEQLRDEAFGILKRYADLKLSYADAVGAAIAQQQRVDAVFGLDSDFRIMGFTLVPE
ncbi:MAG: type II toxin-antitoxin system VapC family toxin [Mycobacteriales bacterium]